MKKLLLILLMVILYCSCEKKDEIVDITNQCIFPEDNYKPCYSISADTIIIQDTNTYYNVFNTNNLTNYNCDTVSLPDIDFNTYSLLGILTIGSGCSADYKRKIFKDISNKKIIYSISIEYSGLCEMLIYNWNFTLVPKVPDEYTVDFQLE